jgi:hypothetical protein
MKTPYLFSEAELQSQHGKEDIAIRNLFHDQDIYTNYPDFQRDYVWPDKFRRALIDSILRGFPIHPLLAYKELDQDGREIYYIFDGRQRLTTIYDFMAGKFSTSSNANSREEEHAFPPVEPNRTFQELSDRSRNLFLSYKFTINLIDGSDKRRVAMLFRRIQHQMPLRASEKLASYTSVASKYALRLANHSFWNFYTGETKHKEKFQGSLMLIALELAQGYTSAKSTHLTSLVSGKCDRRITPDFCDALEARLEVLMHVFAGSAFSLRASIIPMYQAILFLEEQGFTFTTSHKGCLTSWLGQILWEADQTGIRGFTHPIASLQNVNRQQDFWETQLPIIIEHCKSDTANVA